MTRTRGLSLFVFLALLAGSACKPKLGGACEGDEMLCTDSKTALACVAGKYAAVPCRGTGGCTGERGHATCDDSSAQAGDACLPSREKSETCASDGENALACTGGHYVLRATCRGPKGCKVNGASVVCDGSLGTKGDPCTKDGAYACTPDKKDALVCRGGHFELSRSCRGSQGCGFEDDYLRCDESAAREGDTCSKDSLIACNEEGTAELTCIAGRFGRPRPCPKGCKVVSHKRIECEP